MKNTINCPDCSKEINVSEFLTDQITENLSKKFKEEYAGKLNEVNEIKKRLKLEEHKQKENLEKLLIKKMNEHKIRLQEEVNKENKELLNSLNNQINKKTQQVIELKKVQIENENLKRHNDTIKVDLELKFQKKLNDELQKSRYEITQEQENKASMIIKELQEKLRQQEELHKEALKKQQQGSMQSQGEAFELVVEDYLKKSFTTDQINPIGKGVKGADCIQIIRHEGFEDCGSIYYECKRTKNFSQSWIEKFKSDIREINANIGILVTEVMPDDRNLIKQDNIWICKFSEFKIVSRVVRDMLIKIHLEKVTNKNSNSKSLELYNYLTSEDFFYRVKNIVDGFNSLQQELIKEKNRAYKDWATREKNHNKVLENILSFAGSIKSIAGINIPLIENE